MIRLFLVSCLMLVLVGCGFAAAAPVDPAPGFFGGFWHGILAPMSIVLRAFMDIATYAHPNSGWGYDCGFVLGVIFGIPTGLGPLGAIVETIRYFLFA